MENITASPIMEFVTNETLIKQVAINFFNGSVANVSNQSVLHQETLFDLYEAYRTKEKEQLIAYKIVAYVVGTLIILSNLIVVISSGLILRRGQQPKSTYLLLGNVSLADTIIGAAIIFEAVVDNNMASNPLCVFEIGMIVCPAIVSIFSVGLIAVDRYFYILHGLYYQKYVNTTRVRIAIVIIWMIGLILGFMPATGWVNNELIYTRCYYHALFPGALILLISFLSLIPITLVTILYSIILVRALKTVKEIKAASKPVNLNSNSNETPKLRRYRGNINRTFPKKPKKTAIRRCSSLNAIDNSRKRLFTRKIEKSKSIDHLDSFNGTDDSSYNDKEIVTSQSDTERIRQRDFKLGVFTIKSNYSIAITPSPSSKSKPHANNEVLNKFCKEKPPKPKEPNRWRAIIVVMLTTGSLLFTWLPYFVTVTFFVFCEDKLTNPRCIQYRIALGGSIPTLAFLNSILNPLIYAWWHKGFQKTVRNMFKKYRANTSYAASTYSTRLQEGTRVRECGRCALASPRVPSPFLASPRVPSPFLGSPCSTLV
ncbi:5-hydroxytryptamine receptor 1A-like [Cydia strobilella]|uniref:5-hydroxytryptamine receptor 1A-like n=1 Tax=Cydia strobilella TaxID=1100964 RepID=UPI003006603A